MWRERHTGRMSKDDRDRDWSDTAASQWTKRIGSHQQWPGRGKEMSSPTGFRALSTPGFGTASLQNCERMNPCCSVTQFVVLSFSSPGKLIWGTRGEACTWRHPTVPCCEVELRSFTPQLKGLTWSVSLPFGKSKQPLLMFSFSASLYFFTVGQRSLKPTWWFHLPAVSVA